MKPTIIILTFALLFSLSSCANIPSQQAEQASAAEETYAEDNSDADTDAPTSETVSDASDSDEAEDEIVFSDDNPTYDPSVSHNTLIVSCDFSRADEAEALFERLNLTVVYKYENFNMYCVSMDRDFSDSELDQLISALESYDFIYYAEKDGIMTID